MKRPLIGLAVALVVVGAGVFAFREPLLAAAMNKITADMFVASDTDAYDPGVAVGQIFPAIRARYRDREITRIGEFVGPRGMVIVVNRSVDW